MINNHIMEKDRPLQKFIDERKGKYNFIFDYNKRIYREGFNWIVDTNSKWYILGNQDTIMLVKTYIESIWKDKEIICETNIKNVSAPDGYGIILAESIEIEKWYDSLGKIEYDRIYVLGCEMEATIRDYVENI